MRRLAAVSVALLLIVGCSAAPVPRQTPSPALVSTPAATSSPTDPWATDLAYVDKAVRELHPGPFTIHTEAEWTAKLDELRRTLPGATPNEQLAQLASLVGLLDTHSGLEPPFATHQYELLLYPFSDGWFVIRAADPSLVGLRLISIDGTPVADVEARLTPLVQHDNESGLLDGLQGVMSSEEYLDGVGIVHEARSPHYLLEKPDGSRVTVDPPSVLVRTWEAELGIIGDLVGSAPEAVARRGEPVWTRFDGADRVFLISYNDYVDPSGAIAEMKAALDSGNADRVVLDLRYLRGGQGGMAVPLVDALAADRRVNRPGGLTVLIGRENVSAGTVVVKLLDDKTEALFVGEPTPARADNFLCECVDITLPNSGFIVNVPTEAIRTGDSRPAIAPDIPMALASTDFFAGQDPVLDAALRGFDVSSPSP